MAQVILVSPEVIRNTPSRRDGISEAVEKDQRVYGCQLIQKAGILLELEAVTIASGQILFHRFYSRRSMKEFDVRRMAAASLWLACKLEEDPRPVQHIINIFHFLKKVEECGEKIRDLPDQDYVLLVDGSKYRREKLEMFRCELQMLRELGFMMSQALVHPHRYILQYIHALFKGNWFVHVNALSQRAWGYLNDSMCSTLCCEVQPAVIAVGSIYLAACDIDLPLKHESRWYELFDVTWEDVERVCTAILSLYKQPPPVYRKLAEPLDVDTDEEEVQEKAVSKSASKHSKHRNGKILVGRKPRVSGRVTRWEHHPSKARSEPTHLGHVSRSRSRSPIRSIRLHTEENGRNDYHRIVKHTEKADESTRSAQDPRRNINEIRPVGRQRRTGWSDIDPLETVSAAPPPRPIR